MRIKNNDPSAVRIRDNQRRSRNRRADLFQDLQQRVREYELRGIAATMEMQQAARKVLQENAMLRELLAQHSITKDVIDSHLQSFAASRTQNVHGATTASEVGTPGDEQQFLGAAFSATAPAVASTYARLIDPSCLGKQSIAPHHPSVNYIQNSAAQHEVPTDDAADFLLSLMRSPSTMNEPNGHAQETDGSNDGGFTTDTSGHSLCPNDDDCFCAPTTPYEQGHASPAATEMSCETAASILADLWGHTDTYSIRTSLGCVEAAECIVKTFSVLQMME
ncbi:hypothetical protein IFR05_007282 [Cadophora sp. M221]|nr:hypothetical protein IFR05_007282 [Cadophora sp. M221]